MMLPIKINKAHRILYHYQPYNKKYLEQTLRDLTIHLKQPETFNDPWDCRPWYDLEGLNDDSVREAHIKYFTDPNLAHVFGNITATQLRSNPEKLLQMVRESTEHLWKLMNDKYRLYCFTPKEDNELMWSHYAKSHSGICLRFNAESHPISQACQLFYQETLPVLDLLDPYCLKNINTDTPSELLLTKSAVWSYEEEYRLLAYEITSDRTDEFKMAQLPFTINNFLKLPKGALTGIIIGCLSSNANEIIKMVKKYQPQITVQKANRNHHAYGLTFDVIYKA